MSNHYRAGIIGCGSIARLHAEGYRGVEGIEIAAIADTVPGALQEFGERYSVTAQYTDFREMLEKERLDIVSVCTWHRLHAPITVAACRAGVKAVICEKPMATNLGECDEMMTVARHNKVKLAIAHQRRFNPVWTLARNLVREGAIGEPRQVVAKGGQGLLNDCSHHLDMMRYVLADPQALWVMGNLERKTDRYERDLPIEDRSMGVFQFDNGALGLLLQELAAHNYQGGVFYGSEGILDMDEQKLKLLNTKTGSWEERGAEGENPSVAQARELTEWIEGRAEHRGEASNGRAAVEIIMGIYESARRHEVVQLPLQTRSSPLELMIEEGQLPVERPGRYDIRSFLLREEPHP